MAAKYRVADAGTVGQGTGPGLTHSYTKQDPDERLPTRRCKSCPRRECVGLLVFWARRAVGVGLYRCFWCGLCVEDLHPEPLN